MICHFQGGGRGRANGARPPGPRPPASSPSLPTPAPDPGPLGPLLSRLVGREVTLLAGGRLHTGRLLNNAPVTLVDASGSATIIAAPVISVQF